MPEMQVDMLRDQSAGAWRWPGIFSRSTEVASHAVLLRSLEVPRAALTGGMWGGSSMVRVVADEGRDLFPTDREDFAKGRDLQKGRTSGGGVLYFGTPIAVA
jgi:hypothetical protein